MNKRVSALSGSNRLCFSSYMSPTVEKKCSDGTDVGGGDRYRSAKSQRTGNRNLLSPHQDLIEFPSILNMLVGSV